MKSVSNRNFLIHCCALFSSGNGQCDQSLDVFTFGLTLNELFTEEQHQFSRSNKRIKLTKQSPIFADLITRCIDDEPRRRPTAAELQDILNKFRRAADNYIDEKHFDYANQTLKAKNSIIIKIYNEFQKHESETEPLQVYRRPPTPHMNPDLIRHHFDDMMFEFNQINSESFHRPRDRGHSAKSDKWKKYFFDEPIDVVNPVLSFEPMQIDRRSRRSQRSRRSMSPPASFRQFAGEQREQVIHIVQHRRARTPNPSPFGFDDVAEHREHFVQFKKLGQENDMDNVFESHFQHAQFNADFDQRFVQMHRRRQQFK